MDPEFDLELIKTISEIEDPQERMNALEQAIDASKVIDGWSSDILVSARPYIILGLLPPRDEPASLT